MKTKLLKRIRKNIAIYRLDEEISNYNNPTPIDTNKIFISREYCKAQSNNKIETGSHFPVYITKYYNEYTVLDTRKNALHNLILRIERSYRKKPKKVNKIYP